MPKFIKKPIAVEAIQWVGSNSEEVQEFIHGHGFCEFGCLDNYVKNQSGKAQIFMSDWIIKGVDGEFYPCPANVFEASYVEAA